VAFTEQAKTPDEAAALLRNRVVPKRDTVLQISISSGLAERRQRAAPEGNRPALSAGAHAPAVDGRRHPVVALLVGGDGLAHVNRLQREIERQRRSSRTTARISSGCRRVLVDVQEQERGRWRANCTTRSARHSPR
jgi:hypothetical protein